MNSWCHLAVFYESLSNLHQEMAPHTHWHEVSSEQVTEINIFMKRSVTEYYLKEMYFIYFKINDVKPVYLHLRKFFVETLRTSSIEHKIFLELLYQHVTKEINNILILPYSLKKSSHSTVLTSLHL